MPIFPETTAGRRVTVLVALIVALASLLVASLSAYSTYEVLYEETNHRLVSDVNKEATLLKEEFLTPDNMLHFLTQTPPILSYWRSERNGGQDPVDINSNVDLWVTRMETIFTSALNANDVYKRLRVVDIEGNEVMRADKNTNGSVFIPAITDRENLRSTKVFSQSLLLNNQGVYISEVHLYREDGQIVKPYMPVLTFSIAIFEGGSPVPVGFMVLDVDFDKLFNNLPFDHSITPIFLVDETGYLLAHPDSTKLWGIDLDHHTQFADEFPKIAEKIALAEEGQITLDGLVWAFSSVHPNKNASGRKWIYLREEPITVLYDQISSYIYLAGFLFIFVVLVAVSFSSVLRQNAIESDEGTFTSKIGQEA